MATLTVRGFDDELHARLRVRAASHGRSMEAEVKAILAAELSSDVPEAGLGSRIRARFAGIARGDTEFGDIEFPAREEAARAATGIVVVDPWETGERR